MASIDASDIFKLAADLGEVPKTTGPYLGKALGVTSLKVKQAWAEKVGSGLNPALPYAIDYTVKGGRGAGGGSLMESEIGFNKSRRAGALGNISEYGTLFHPPRGFGAAALQENIDDFEKGIDFALATALRMAGL
jgi:hypothetical protein